jgi:hypothetical protein
MSVAIITATLRVHDIAPQADQRPVLAPEIERHWRELKAALNLTLAVAVAAIPR